MITSAEEFVRLRSSDIREEYLRAAHEEASESTWRDVIAKYPEMRKWVAHNKSIPDSIIELLSDEDDNEVLSFLASKRKTPKPILQKLAKSLYENVRLAIAFNPKSTPELLQTLLQDDWDEVRRVAEKRLIESM